MNSNFLKAADRGRSHLKHYALAFFLASVSLLGYGIFLSIALVVYSLVSGFSIEQFSVEDFSCNSQLFFASSVYFFISFIFLFLTLKIHKRPPTTLIRSGELIRYQRALYSFLSWFLIRVFSSVLFSLFYPENYSINKFSIANISVLFLGLILCFSVSLLVFVLLAYILQGMNQIIENQYILILCFSLLGTSISYFSEDDLNPFYFLTGFIYALFWLFIILKDEGVELNIGWLTATAFYLIFCARSNVSDLPELLSQCPALVVAQPVPEMISYPISIAQISIFYYLFFVFRDRNKEGAN